MSTAKTTLTLEAIRSIPVFALLSDGEAEGLRALLRQESFAAGSTLFQAGDAGTSMYLVIGGRVCISIRDEDGHEVVLTELGQGDYFGEMAIIDGKARSASARITQDAVLAELVRTDFLAFVDANPAVALEMLSATFERLRHSDELLRQRVSRNVNEEQAKHMTLSDRLADGIAEFGGSWRFIGSFMVFVLAWALVNTWMLRDQAFDTFPYVFLNLVLAVVASMQAPIIMMSQNRQQEKDRLRSDLDFQVNLKNELALTEVLRRLDVLESERLPQLFQQRDEKLERLLSLADLSRSAGQRQQP